VRSQAENWVKGLGQDWKVKCDDKHDAQRGSTDGVLQQCGLAAPHHGFDITQHHHIDLLFAEQCYLMRTLCCLFVLTFLTLRKELFKNIRELFVPQLLGKCLTH